MKLQEIEDYERLGSVKGSSLEGLKYQHTIMKREGSVVLANYVTLTDGTGCVHTAPGHGQDDYQTGLKYKMPIVSPVDATGIFTEEAGDFAGLNIYDANKTIAEKLDELGLMLHMDKINHSYPHCWRLQETGNF